MFFFGTYPLTIDGKCRLSVPFAVRSQMNPESEGRGLYAVPGRRPHTLAIYPDRYFHELRRRWPDEESLSDEAYEWRQFECSQTVLLDPDAQGRVLIPQWLLESAGLSKDVTLIGVQDHLELWNRADFEAFEKTKWPEYPRHRAKALSELRHMAGKADATSAPQEAK
ncbi:MAG: division/cell wall cluster transcriptional repressor MraZ [Phycisphaerae bacterium]